MKVVYFVRHGQSRANIEEVFAGSRYDVPLTDTGFDEAKATGAALRSKPIDVIVSSPLKRAKQTAESIAREIGYNSELLFEPMLKERDFGEATGMPWSSGIGERVDAGNIKDLETIEQLADRMRRVLEWFKMVPGTHILVVGHGTAELMMQTMYQGRPAATFLQTKELKNGEIREYHITS